jgi:hypothetical protein
VASATAISVSVNFASSITYRLVALLNFLHTNYPAEGWDLITAAGHSQGGGHAGSVLCGNKQLDSDWASTLGAILNVNSTSAPFNSSRQLSTSAAPNPSGPTSAPTHGALVVDAVTPLDSQGQPLFKPIWTFL